MANKKGTSGNDSLIGTAAADVIDGLLGADLLSGLGGNDNLKGGGGNDRLDGGLGNDIMAGGDGNDNYVVDSSGDSVRELVDQGTDTVLSGVSYTLPVNVERVTLTGSRANNATGNTLDNVLAGNTGNNRLNGGTGADTMRGGRGNDTYRVDEVGDVVTEAAREGTDLVESLVAYTLKTNFENLTLLGAEDLDGTGNSATNVITGNSGANRLDGLGGKDTLLGAAGNDTLVYDATDTKIDGGDGFDTLEVGGSGKTVTLGTATNLFSLEHIDLGEVGNTLSVTAAKIVSLSQNDTLVVDGAGTGRVIGTGAWHFEGETAGYARYKQGNATLDVAVTLDRSGLNRPPVAVKNNVNVAEDGSVVISVASLLGNDTDSDGDSLSFVGFTAPATGALVDNNDGTFTYTPPANFNGPDGFTYTITDGTSTVTGQVDLTVTSVNDVPVAVDDSLVVDQNTAVTFSAGSLVLNDLDDDGDVLNVASVSAGAHGVAILSNGVITYTPDPGYFGTDSFAYTVNDGHGGTATAQVVVTVNQVVDPNLAPLVSLTGGDATIPVGAGIDVAGDVRVLADGKILLLGKSIPALGGSPSGSVVRLNPDGSLDTSFGVAGKLLLAPEVLGDPLATSQILPDGKIVVASRPANGLSSDLQLLRFNPDGSLDQGFGEAGQVLLPGGDFFPRVDSFVPQPDGSLLVMALLESLDANQAIRQTTVITRLTPNGAPDPGFGINGSVERPYGLAEVSLSEAALAADGKIVLAGSQTFEGVSAFDLFRLNPDGSPDFSFGAEGKLELPQGLNSVQTGALQFLDDGSLLLAGTITGQDSRDFILVKITSQGALDLTFGDAGAVLVGGSSFISELADSLELRVLADGRIVLGSQTLTGGEIPGYTVVRLGPDGTPDASFGDNGRLFLSGTYSEDFTLQADGKLLFVGGTEVDGNIDYAVLRLNTDGTLDTSFNQQSFVIVPYEAGQAPTPLAFNGSLFDFELATRGNYNGASLSFERQGGANPDDVFGGTGAVPSLVEDGDVVVAGTVIGTVLQNSNGRLLLGFNANATQSLIDTALRSITYVTPNPLPPIHTDIAITFNDGNDGQLASGPPLSATAIASVTTFNDAPVLNTGMPAVSLFNLDGGRTGGVVTTYGNGQLVIAGQERSAVIVGSGSSIQLQLHYDFSVTRVNADGTLDTAFGADGRAVVSVSPLVTGIETPAGIAVQATGSIVVLGTVDSSHFQGSGSSYGSGSGSGSGSGFTTFDKDLGLVRLNPDGSLDTGFGSNGRVLLDFGSRDNLASSVVVANDGKLLVGGTLVTPNGVGQLQGDFSLFRLDANGAIDPTFGFGGVALIDASGTGENDTLSTVVQVSGGILLAGTSNLPSFFANISDFTVVKLDPNGQIDMGFASEGRLQIDFGGQRDTLTTLALTSSGMLVAGGYAANTFFGTEEDMVLARFSQAGVLDPTFGVNGRVQMEIGSQGRVDQVIEDSQGRLLVAGHTVIADAGAFATLVRLNPDGTRDTSFSGDGIVILDYSPVSDPVSISLLANDQILLVRQVNNYLAATRINADGSLDQSLDNTSQFSLLFYQENAAPVAIDPAMSVFDAELSAFDNFDGASILVNAFAGGDSFVGTGLLSSLEQGAPFSINGVEVGTVVNNQAGTLKLTFNNAATQALVNLTLQSIGYQQSSDAPAPNTTIQWYFDDGNRGAQGVGGIAIGFAETRLLIKLVNDAPFAVGDNLGVLSDKAGSLGFNVSLLLNNDFDPDAGDFISLSSIDSVTAQGGVVVEGVYTPAPGFIGTDSFNYTIIDSHGVTATATATITVVHENLAPLLALEGGSTHVAVGAQPDGAFGAVLLPDGSTLLVGASRVAGEAQLGIVSLTRDGTLNDGFGDGGRVLLPTGPGYTNLPDAVRLPDGKLLVLGITPSPNLQAIFQSSLSLVRLNPDGSPDQGFGVNGRLELPVAVDSASDLAVQADGRVLIAGSDEANELSQFMVIRVNADGSLDAGFGVDGVVLVPLSGELSTAEQLVIQPDGKILAVGPVIVNGESDMGVVRLNPDGSLDTSFGTNGTLVLGQPGYDTVHSVVLQADGKILLSGESGTDTARSPTVVRLNPDGSLDSGFGVGGSAVLSNLLVSDPVVRAPIVIQPDGMILVGGSHNSGTDYDFAVSRLTADGLLDTSFGNGGTVIQPIGGGIDIVTRLLLLPDGRIELVGASQNGGGFDFAALRLLPDGSIDRSFNKQGFAEVIHEPGQAPVLLSSTINVFDKELSLSDNYDGTTLSIVRSGGANADDLFVATGGLQPLVEGQALVYDGVFIGTVIQNSGGQLLLQFLANSSQDLITDSLRSIAYDTFNPEPPPRISLLWTFSDGNFAGTQGIGGAGFDQVLTDVVTVNNAPMFAHGAGRAAIQQPGGSFITAAVAVRPDGSIITVGDATSGTSEGQLHDIGIVRTTPTGLPDQGFGSGGRVTLSLTPFFFESATGVAVLPDGGIVVSAFSNFSFGNDFTALRFDANGALVASLQENDGALVARAESVAVQPDGKIVLAGTGNGGPSYGSSDFRLMRLDGNLNPESSFGNGSVAGVAHYDISGSGFRDLGHSVVVQANGGIVVAGESQGLNGRGLQNDIAVLRVLGSGASAGSPDLGFGVNGVARFDFFGFDDGAYDVIDQADGGLIVTGYSNNGLNNDLVVLRLTATGTLDPSFGVNGVFRLDLGAQEFGYSVVQAADGRLLVAALQTGAGVPVSEAIVLRLNPDGTLDTSFGNFGKVRVDVSSGKPDLALQPDGRIVVSTTDIGGVTHLTSLSPNGQLDPTFNDGTQRSVVFIEENGSATLDPYIQLFDAELDVRDNYDGARLVIQQSDGVNDFTDFFYSTGGRLGSLSQTNPVVVDGIVIGTVVQASGGRLELAFNANATADRVTATLHSIGYSSFSDTPQAIVDLQWTFTDGNTDGTQGLGGVGTALANTRVYITPFNDPAQVLLGNHVVGLNVQSNDFAGALVTDFNGNRFVAGDSVLGGQVTLTVSKVLPNGVFDNTFDADGRYFLDLTTRFVAAQTDDYPAASFTNGVIAEGELVGLGTIGSAGDHDWFAVSLQGGQTYTFSMAGQSTGDGTLVDPVIAGIYDSSGQFIAAGFNDDAGSGRNALAAFTPGVAGIYYVDAAGFGTGTGSYALKVNSSLNDDFSNNVRTAGVVAFDAFGTINYLGDQDWFQTIPLQAGSHYVISMQGLHSNNGTLVDPVIGGIYDSAGSLINGTYNDDSGIGFDSQIRFTPTGGGTYFVQVQGYNDSHTGTYRLTIYEEDSLTPDTATSGVISSGAPVAGLISEPQDIDWYAVTLVGGEVYDIAIKGAAANAGTLANPLLVGLYDANGQLLANTSIDDSNGTLDPFLQFVAPAAGVYYVAVGGGFQSNPYVDGTNESTGTYAVSVKHLQDDFSADTYTVGAANLADFPLQGTIDSVSDVDWVRVSLVAGASYSVELRGLNTGNGTLGDPRFVGLFDSNGVFVPGTSDDDSGGSLDAMVSFTASSSGDYFLASTGTAGTAGSYTLYFNQTDDYGNDNATAPFVSAGQSLVGRIEQNGDVDRFAVFLQAGVNYTFTLPNTGAQDALSIPTFTDFSDAGGNSLGGTGPNFLGVVPGQTGVYYLSVASGQVGETGSYRLTVLQDDYPAGILTTGSLAVGGVVAGSFEAGFDNDWIAVNLTAGLTYSFAVAGEGAAGVNSLQIRDAGGGFVQNSTGTALDFVADTTATYFLEVQNASALPGDYTVSLLANDDYTGTAIGSGQLVSGQALTGTINFAFDLDWFKVNLLADVGYSFDISSPDGATAPVFDGVFDSAGNVLTSSGFTGLGFSTSAAGTYYISARSSDTGTGNYTINFNQLDDFAESVNTTGVLNVGEKVNGVINVPVGGVADRDFFGVTLQANHTYLVTLQNANEPNGLQLPRIDGIYDSQGSFVDGGSANYDVTGKVEVLFTPKVTGEYFVSAAGAFFGNNTGAYALSLVEMNPVTSLLNDPQGRTLVATTTNSGFEDYDVVLTRLLPNGAPDQDLGGAGIIHIDVGGLGSDDLRPVMVLDTSVRALLTPPIFVAATTTNTNSPNGDTDVALVRLFNDGSIDQNFGGGHVLVDVGGLGLDDTVSQILVDSAGRVLLAGTSNNGSETDFSITRLLSDGSLDETFGGGDGTVVLDATDFFENDAAYNIALTAAGDIVLAGVTNFGLAVVRLKDDGSMDTTFGSNGRVPLFGFQQSNAGTAMSVDDLGRIVLASAVSDAFSSDISLTRLNVDGSVDTGFGYAYGTIPNVFSVSGALSGFQVADIHVDSDGYLTLTGHQLSSFFSPSPAEAGDVSVIRLNPAGLPDVLVGYTLGTAPVPLAPFGDIYDPELYTLGNYNGSTLTVTRHGGASFEDVFMASDSNLGPLVEGGPLVMFGSAVVGEVIQNSGGTLTLSFNENGNVFGFSPVNVVLEHLAYANLNTFNPTHEVHLDFTFNDGNTGQQGIGGTNGGLAVTATTTVVVGAINVVQGTFFSETLSGTAQNDLLVASGNDDVFGQEGNDVLVAGDGFNQLYGGAGDDVFYFDGPNFSSTNVIIDFQNAGLGGGDLIGLDGNAFSDLPLGAVSPDAFLAYDGFFNEFQPSIDYSPSQHLLYNRTDFSLFYDRDGPFGQEPAIRLGYVNFGFDLNAGDFLVYAGIPG